VGHVSTCPLRSTVSQGPLPVERLIFSAMSEKTEHTCDATLSLQPRAGYTVFAAKR